LENRGLRENRETLYIVDALHSLVRRTPPLLGIFAFPISRRIL
jgi:hypothetical protein